MNLHRSAAAILTLVGLVSACAAAPARREGAPPDLLLVVLEGEPVAVEAPVSLDRFVEAEVIHTDPMVSWRALLTGQWPGTSQAAVPNSLHGVMALYGYTVYAGPSPQLDAVLAAEPGLGRPAARLALDCPGSWLRDGIDALDRGPAGDPLLVMLPVRAEPGCGGVAGVGDAVSAAARWGMEADRAVVIVGLQAAAAGAPLLPAPAHPALWMRDGADEPAPRLGLSSVLDVMPTVLTAGGAVVPTDAAGQPLQLLRRRGPQAAPAALVQQAPDGSRAAVTRAHRLVVPAGLEAGPTPPAQAVLETRAAAELGPALPPKGAPPAAKVEEPVVDDERARAALWAALQSWQRAVGGSDPEARVGADALRKVLAEQGYFQ